MCVRFAFYGNGSFGYEPFTCRIHYPLRVTTSHPPRISLSSVLPLKLVNPNTQCSIGDWCRSGQRLQRSHTPISMPGPRGSRRSHPSAVRSGIDAASSLPAVFTNGRDRKVANSHTSFGPLMVATSAWLAFGTTGKGKGGEVIESRSIITIEANKLMRTIQDRMPVIPKGAGCEGMA